MHSSHQVTQTISYLENHKATIIPELSMYHLLVLPLILNKIDSNIKQYLLTHLSNRSYSQLISIIVVYSKNNRNICMIPMKEKTYYRDKRDRTHYLRSLTP
jgi:hypothetical protein